MPLAFLCVGVGLCLGLHVYVACMYMGGSVSESVYVSILGVNDRKQVSTCAYMCLNMHIPILVGVSVSLACVCVWIYQAVSMSVGRLVSPCASASWCI